MSHAIRVLVSNRECVYGLICDAHLCPRKERGSTDGEGGSVVQISASVHSEACLISNPRVIRSEFEGVETRKPRHVYFWDGVKLGVIRCDAAASSERTSGQKKLNKINTRS
jgi:hypothetical protein